MSIIKLINKICAVNLSEPCRDDLKRLSDENKRLLKENEELKQSLNDIFEYADKLITFIKNKKSEFNY